MNKLLLIICFSSLAVFNLRGLQSMNGNLISHNDTFGLSFEPSFGYLIGENREIVYLDSTSSKYLSELIWDLKDILYTGAAVSANFVNRFYINAGLWTAVTGGNGFMNDFDWYNLTGTSYPTYDSHGRTGWTHWSLSEVEIIKSLFIDANISYDFIPRKQFAFNAIVGYKYIYWDWTDKVLDATYPPGWTPPEVGSDAIDYQLGLHIPYLGLGFEWRPEIGFSLLSRIIYSPLVIGGDHDHHIQRETYLGSPTYGGIHFYDNIRFGQFLSGTIKVGYSFTYWFTLMTQLSGEYLFETRGDTLVYDNLDDYKGTISNGAGIQYQSLSASINLLFSF